MPIEGDSLLDDDADELDVRAPDESKKMQLIDNTAVNSPFLDAEVWAFRIEFAIINL
jgi:hypothetical protein